MTRTAFGVLVLACCVGCGSDGDGDGLGGIGSGGQGASLGGSIGVGIGGGGISVGGGNLGGAPSFAGSGNGSFTLPPDFTKADAGGWKLGDPVTSAPPPTGSGGCNNRLTGIVRDFQARPNGHPDFEVSLAGNAGGLRPGLVRAELGADQKPVYAPSGSTPVTAGAMAFDQWYHSAAGVNQPFYLTLFLVPSGGSTFTFQSNAFFPLDGAGFGNSGRACSENGGRGDDDEQGEQGAEHNFHFTFELHTQFRYAGGEEFTFIGDDDVFVFINGRLALDLGGVHGEEDGTIDLDEQARELGITPGNSYSLDMFHAERHLCASNFRVDTTLQFTDCGTFVPDVPR